MSRTLFLYIFKDLIKIFLLACGVLAAIMSFGGLLRPLTEHGLGAAQVARMLTYFMPAMMTYSLPVASLFATTIVYGRLSADNELTACRAAGISALWVAFPAFMLGIIVSVISFVFLFFIVPQFSLKVEKVIYSNIAQLVANQIERTHRIQFDQNNRPLTIFAQRAEVLPPDPREPGAQIVRLFDPVFVTYEHASDRDRERKRVIPPSDFFMANSATAYITQDERTGEITLRARLSDGAKFPRRYRGNSDPAIAVNIEHTEFKSEPMESPVRENTKFMELVRLQELLKEPEKSRRMRRLLAEFIRDDQRNAYLQGVASALLADGAVKFDAGSETYLLERGSAPVELKGERLIIGSVNGPAPAQPPRLRQLTPAGGPDATAREVVIRATPEQPAPGATAAANTAPAAARRLAIQIQLNDALVRSGQITTSRVEFPRSFSVPMSDTILAIDQNRVNDYLAPTSPTGERQNRLKRDLAKLTNSIVSEAHARASFSVSCLILVLVGCALGMMFRSGNFLSAFALSVIPAMLCILLIISGQHTAESVPWNIDNFQNPLVFGVWMIWMGNIVIAVLAAVLLGRLQRQ